ncbi:hypothetical protein WMY93_009508 [Mugilogobius chulae]|uniref:Secreted protein n=1 Tax=Mugilogobius chulae TaxID=88201 RepID=A0AAW0PBZ4_9GOBI
MPTLRRTCRSTLSAALPHTVLLCLYLRAASVKPRAGIQAHHSGGFPRASRCLVEQCASWRGCIRCAFLLTSPGPQQGTRSCLLSWHTLTTAIFHEASTECAEETDFLKHLAALDKISSGYADL